MAPGLGMHRAREKEQDFKLAGIQSLAGSPSELEPARRAGPAGLNLCLQWHDPDSHNQCVCSPPSRSRCSGPLSPVPLPAGQPGPRLPPGGGEYPLVMEEPGDH